MPPFDTSTATLILWAAISYGLGSVPFGLLVTQALGLGDIRKIGSGNIGTTNVLRTGSKPAAVLTLLLDGGKGAAAVLLAHHFAGPDAAQLAALTSFFGHCYPVWLQFKGGKGVATFLGIWLALAWPVGLACCATWLVAAYTTRMSSFAALAAAAASTFWVMALGQSDTLFLGMALTILVYWRHRANIHRIRAGTEPRIGQKG